MADVSKRAAKVNLTGIYGNMAFGPLGLAVMSVNGHPVNPLSDVLMSGQARSTMFQPLKQQASYNVKYDVNTGELYHEASQETIDAAYLRRVVQDVLDVDMAETQIVPYNELKAGYEGNIERNRRMNRYGPLYGGEILALESPQDVGNRMRSRSTSVIYLDEVLDSELPMATEAVSTDDAMSEASTAVSYFGPERPDGRKSVSTPVKLANYTMSKMFEKQLKGINVARDQLVATSRQQQEARVMQALMSQEPVVVQQDDGSLSSITIDAKTKRITIKQVTRKQILANASKVINKNKPITVVKGQGQVDTVQAESWVEYSGPAWGEYSGPYADDIVVSEIIRKNKAKNAGVPAQISAFDRKLLALRQDVSETSQMFSEPKMQRLRDVINKKPAAPYTLTQPRSFQENFENLPSEMKGEIEDFAIETNPPEKSEEIYDTTLEYKRIMLQEKRAAEYLNNNETENDPRKNLLFLAKKNFVNNLLGTVQTYLPRKGYKEVLNYYIQHPEDIFDGGKYILSRNKEKYQTEIEQNFKLAFINRGVVKKNDSLSALKQSLSDLEGAIKKVEQYEMSRYESRRDNQAKADKILAQFQKEKERQEAYDRIPPSIRDKINQGKKK